MSASFFNVRALSDKALAAIKAAVSPKAPASAPAAQPTPAPPLPPPKTEQAPMINWTDPKCSISKYFTVKDACLLPSWGVLHMPSDVEKANILRTAAVMDEIRAFLGAPILVHCWIRPGSVNCPGNPHHGQDYNAFIKGAPKSAHKSGLAVDWHALKESCDTSRARLLPELERLKIRMEDLPKSGWVHIDLNPPNPIRFFKP